MSKLSVGEWRLFLLSECIKEFKEIEFYTAELRREGKQAILDIVTDDAKELNGFLLAGEAEYIRGELRKEWKFTGKVKDNGKGNKSTCEYCQQQQIRYRYLCVNEKNKTWLSLGSVCVGNIIHGEEAMRNREFSENFVSKLESMKSKAEQEKPKQEPKAEQDWTEDAIASLREQQSKVIKPCIQFLRVNCGYRDSDFLQGLEVRWSSGKPLTEPQIDRLIRWCKKEKDKRMNKAN